MTSKIRDPMSFRHPVQGTPHAGDQTKSEILASPDYPVFLDSLLSDGDSVYLNETLIGILGTPEKTCLICTGTPMEICWKSGSRDHVRCVAVCCSVMQCVAVCCSVLQCVAVCCSVLQ